MAAATQAPVLCNDDVWPLSQTMTISEALSGGHEPEGGALKLRPPVVLISTPSRPSTARRGPGWARGLPQPCSRRPVPSSVSVPWESASVLVRKPPPAGCHVRERHLHYERTRRFSGVDTRVGGPSDTAVHRIEPATAERPVTERTRRPRSRIRCWSPARSTRRRRPRAPRRRPGSGHRGRRTAK